MTTDAALPGTVPPSGWVVQPDARRWRCTTRERDEIYDFHLTFPGYAPTPLVDVGELARELSVGRVFVKDESKRLGLSAFKVLGASWAVFRILAERGGTGRTVASFERMAELAESSRHLRLVTATDGNHGRAVAFVADLLGLKARIFVPETVDADVVRAIAAEGADISVVAGAYDDAVRRAAQEAGDDDASVLVQDTAWRGYETVPAWIVEGYSTLFREIDAQLGLAGVGPAPDLVVVPVGVGSLAQAAVMHYRSAAEPAVLMGVEPDSAACVTISLLTGRRTTVATGTTNMAGLNCGTPSRIAWPYLRQGLDAVVTVSDSAAESAGRRLGSLGIDSGHSGAASLAGLRAAVLGETGRTRRADLGLDEAAVVVLLNTEGTSTADPSRGG